MSALALALAALSVSAAPPEVFRAGLGAYYADEYEAAAAAMYTYVSKNEDTVQDHDWAKYFLALSLARLGYSHAAAEHLYDVASRGALPEVLPEALSEIEALVAGPHDEALLLDRLIADGNFGYLPPSVADFVRYYQGLMDLRADRAAWAERQFVLIREESPYRAAAEYALAVERLRAGRDEDAVRRFRLALAHPEATLQVRNDARLALARLLYERGRYTAARKIYDQVEVPELTTAEASLYLEKAWSAYWLRDYRQTMGILYALEAPSYRDYFAPEKSLLRALVYKNLCHYIPAKREIRRFRFRYGAALENIRARIDLRDDEILRTAALSRGSLKRLADFRRLLTSESDRVDTVGGPWVESGLDEHLRGLYELEAKRVDLRLAAELTRAVKKVAKDLTEFEEQMYLLDYEIGLEIYRRLKKEDARRAAAEDALSVPISGGLTYYAFVDEFWNDELSTFTFLVENRCFDEGGER